MERYKHRPKRTQIYLYPEEEVVITTLSQREGRSRAAVVREAIKTYGKKKGIREQSVVEFFKELSKGTEKLNIPSDLSENLDYYLYGEGSEEFK